MQPEPEQEEPKATGAEAEAAHFCPEGRDPGRAGAMGNGKTGMSIVPANLLRSPLVSSYLETPAKKCA